MKDIDEVFRIECDSFSMPWSLESLQQEVDNPIAFYHVALVRDRIVAYGGIRHVLEEGEVTNIAVDKNYRGQGIGRQLLNSLLKQAKTHMLHTVTLEVRKSNEIAAALYTSYHFKQIAIRKHYYQKPAEDAVIMQLQLEYMSEKDS